jgi:predicted HicB family RNase H-like nuclease
MSRSPGRPPLAPNDPSVRMTVRVPSTQFDATYAAARDARQSVAEFVRGALKAAGAVSGDKSRQGDGGA